MPMPQCPGDDATEAEAAAYVDQIEAYIKSPTPTPVCQILQEACDCLKCAGEQPFPDQCARLRALGEQNNCSLTCGST